MFLFPFALCPFNKVGPCVVTESTTSCYSIIFVTWFDFIGLHPFIIIIIYIFFYIDCAGLELHTYKLHLQAMFEGILVDLPFATFFLSKLKQK